MFIRSLEVVISNRELVKTDNRSRGRNHEETDDLVPCNVKALQDSLTALSFVKNPQGFHLVIKIERAWGTERIKAILAAIQPAYLEL